MTNLKQQRRHRLERLLDAKINWVFGEVSPYSADFWAKLERQVGLATRSLLPDLAKELPGISLRYVLANAWAVAIQNPVALALLARAAESSEDPEVLAERRRLMRLTAKLIRQDACAEVVLSVRSSSTGAPPNLWASRALKPGLRLRYALAHSWARGSGSRALLVDACDQPGCSTFVRARELLHAMEAVRPESERLEPLSEDEFATLPPRMQAVAVARDDLRVRLLPDSLCRDVLLAERVRVARQRARDANHVLRALRERLYERDFVAAEAELAQLEADLATCDQAAVVFARFDASVVKRLSDKDDDESVVLRAWRPLSDGAWNKITKLAPDVSLPPWWRLDAHSIATFITRDAAAIDQIPFGELAMVGRGWTESDHRQLLAAGHYGLVPADAVAWDVLGLQGLCEAAAGSRELLDNLGQRMSQLKDARPILALLGAPTGPTIKAAAAAALEEGVVADEWSGWSQWVAPCIGTPEWHANASLAADEYDLVEEGVNFLGSGGLPVDPGGFRDALSSLLATSAGESPGEGLLTSFLNDQQEAAADLVRLVPAARIEAAVQSGALEPDVLERVQRDASGSLRESIWQFRASRVSDAASLRGWMLEKPDWRARLPWRREWLHLPGSPEDKAIALVLAAQGVPSRLRSLADRVGEDVLREALAAAAALLPAGMRRERGFLQLGAALGVPLLAPLRKLLFLSEKEAPAGCKFDRCYREYLLPKKSGGNRVISVPPRPLKRVQKAILARLLAPLGAHDAAFGFVPKRSIHDNASAHVGQEVVANADVENCFPNIKWSLVLGVLRRDLGHRLGPEAISLLVDICTSKGGLPIGAPTSPALLNRVLLRTDELVQRAAVRRGCRYTRYADDLTFSGDHRAVEMLGVAKRTLAQIGLRLDAKKTSIYRPGRRQMVTGLVVNQQVSIPRRLRRRLRAAVHAVEQGRQPHWHGHEKSLASLEGRLAFLGQIHPEQAGPLKLRLSNARGSEGAGGDD